MNLLRNPVQISHKLVLIIALLTILIRTAFSAEIPKEETTKDVAVVREDGFLIIPHAWYRPETSLAGGFVLLTYFRTEEFPVQIRPSTVATTFTYTLNQQFIWELLPEIYLAGDKFHLIADIHYKSKPYKFYGIGNDTPHDIEEEYKIKIFNFTNELQRKIGEKIYLGWVYQYHWTVVSNYEDGGLLETGEITGSREGAASGMGLSFNFDNRDNHLFTAKGGYYKFSAVSFGNYFGSKYRFDRYIIDMRQFVPLWKKKHVIGFQAYAHFTSGDPPFDLMATLGGKDRMRGYYEGRYRDNNYLVFQSEYRVHLGWRILLTAFAGVGDVSHRVDEFRAREFKFAYGGGIRFTIKPEEKINLRVDVARSPDLTGFYVTVGEAF